MLLARYTIPYNNTAQAIYTRLGFYRLKVPTDFIDDIKRHFQMHFLEWKFSDSDSNFTEVYSDESNW